MNIFMMSCLEWPIKGDTIKGDTSSIIFYYDYINLTLLLCMNV